MLRELSIKAFAIIDDLRIRLDEGLTILSGETGAGKSIIINAVNLLLGSRASDRLVRTGEEAAELEALFEIRPESPTAELMRENDLDPDEGLMVRRIISTAGRHRVYITAGPPGFAGTNGFSKNLSAGWADPFLPCCMNYPSKPSPSSTT